MRIYVLSSILHNPVQLHAWVLIDVDVWESAFLCHGKILPRWVHCNRANAVCISSYVDLLFVGIDVVYLIGVTRGENDHVVLQVVNVETFVGGHAVAPEELIVAAGY